MIPKIILLGLACCISFSCTVEVNGTIGEQRSVQLTIAVSLQGMFAEYLSDLGLNSKIPTAEALAKELSDGTGCSAKAGWDARTHTWNVQLDAPDAGKIFPGRDPALSGILTFESNASGQTMRIRIDRKAVDAIISLGVKDQKIKNSGVFPKSQSSDSAAYRRDLDFALGDYGTKATRSQMFDATRIHAVLQFPSAVRKASGAKVRPDGRGIEFDVSIIDALVLQKPLLIEVQY